MAMRSIRETSGSGPRRGWPAANSTVRLIASAVVIVLIGRAAGGGVLADGVALAILAGGSWLVERSIDPRAPFGLPNWVTWIRLVATAQLAGFTAVVFAGPGLDGSWTVVAVALTAATLDGFDGWLARRYGPDTPFGARFDMETDALLILVLAAFSLATGKVGAWILVAGLMRYAFVAAAIVFPWLSAPLPPSFRRKLVCVVQILGLILIAAPAAGGAAATAIGLLTIAALTWSFAVDVLWLRRNRTAIR